MKFKILLLILVSFIFFSCGDDGPRLDDDLVEYFDRFQEEAALRNVAFDHVEAGIEAVIVQILSTGVLGQCVTLEDQEYRVIHISKDYWATATDLEKEFVVFHELGHCFLNLPHTNAPDVNGDCISIMYDGFSNACNLIYDLSTREKLLDQLFQ